MAEPEYDIFLSYAEGDKEASLKLRDALRDEGLTVWLEEERALNYDGIKNNFRDGLSSSKALLAYYSREYPKNRTCQWEIAQAFIAGEKEARTSGANPAARIVIINPERSKKHIIPEELHGAFTGRLAENASPGAYKKLAEDIRKHIAGITAPIGQVIALDKPSWYGREGLFHPFFTGRIKDLWDVHYVLRGGNTAFVTGAKDEQHGFLGLGGSFLAEEYAMRFGAAYPGGVYWINAAAPPPRVAEEELDLKLKDLALELDMPITESLSLIELRQELHARVKDSAAPSLWIVDDMPEDMDHEELRFWFAPTQSAKTLITTRSREYGWPDSVHLGVLERDDARRLLGRVREPVNEEEEKKAGGIIKKLGRHALALDVAASIILKEGFAKFYDESLKAGPEEKKLAGELSKDLPRGSAPAIASALLHAVNMTGEEGRDHLRLASVLAPVPLPPEITRDVIARIDGLTGQDAERITTLAAEQLSSLSLAVPAGGGMMQVHPLVSHTISFHDRVGENEERRKSLRVYAIKELRYRLSLKANDPELHREIAAVVTHARELVTTVDMADEAYLTGWIARYDYLRGSYRSAARLYRRGLEFFITVLGEDHLDSLAFMNNYALALAAQADYEEALKIQHRALDIAIETHGQEHPETLTTMSNLALTYWTILDLKKAREIQEKVLALTKRVRGLRHIDTTISAWNLFLTLDHIEDFESSKELLEKDLLWLLDRDPATLSPHERIIRSYVSEAAKRSEQRGEEGG